MNGYDEQAVARWVEEPPKATQNAGRSPFARDRARVLHASAFRRLAGKTQVVHPGESDFPRTRLTHSLECAQIGREIAAALQADPDLVDAACLAHDLGHPPFGHNGEIALNEIASGATDLGDCGGFEGNAQSLRLLSRLEMKVPSAGLNLTRASLDASAKYPWLRPPEGGKFGVYPDDLPVFEWFRAGAPPARRPIETQIMDWADDVAYSVHDYEDGVQSRHIDPARLDTDAVVETARSTYLPAAGVDELYESWQELTAQPWWVRGYDGSPASSAALKAMTSELIGRFSSASIVATRAITGEGPLRRYAGDLAVPVGQRRECALLKGIAAYYVMWPRRGAQERQRGLLMELAAAVIARGPAALDPLLLPSWRAAGSDGARLRVVVDQIAGLTDAGAVALHRRVTGDRSLRGRG